MLLYGRNEHYIVKPLSPQFKINLKIKKKKKQEGTSECLG